MGMFILRRLGLMFLTAICLTFVVFIMTNLPPNLEKLAKTQGNFRMSDAEVASYLGDRGFNRPLTIKYGEWLGVVPSYKIEGRDGKIRSRCSAHGPVKDNTINYCGVLQGYWGQSWVFKEPVANVIDKRLTRTGALMFWVFLLMRMSDLREVKINDIQKAVLPVKRDLWILKLWFELAGVCVATRKSLSLGGSLRRSSTLQKVLLRR